MKFYGTLKLTFKFLEASIYTLSNHHKDIFLSFSNDLKQVLWRIIFVLCTFLLIVVLNFVF